MPDLMPQPKRNEPVPRIQRMLTIQEYIIRLLAIVGCAALLLLLLFAVGVI